MLMPVIYFPMILEKRQKEGREVGGGEERKHLCSYVTPLIPQDTA
jgi:hypothetical protein